MSLSIQPFNVTLGEQSPLFVYTPSRDSRPDQGWNDTNGDASTVQNVYGASSPYRITQLDGAGFALGFQGIALYLCLTLQDAAAFTLMVDNVNVASTASSTDPACHSFASAGLLVVADGLDYGPHTAIFSVHIQSEGDSVLFYGGVVTVSAGPSGTSTTTRTIDDLDPAWTYLPFQDWNHGGWNTDIDQTHSWTRIYSPSETASYTFNGTAIVQLIGGPTVNTYGYSILFNNTLTEYNSTNPFLAIQQTLFLADGLDPSHTYTLTAIAFNQNQPNGPPGVTEMCFPNLDALILIQPSSSTGQPTASNGQQSSSNGQLPYANGQWPYANVPASTPALSGGAIAGIVVGALVLLGVLVAFLMLWRKRRNRVNEGQALSEYLDSGSTPPSPDPFPFPISQPPQYPTTPEAEDGVPSSTEGDFRDSSSPESPPAYRKTP
ncbi:hypothetical protein CALCODRAFT_521358 [Calocera cornea HHB12733]|uniref:Transmembrane protein n=1 Tax=Calocera cornea HHB12733 TaxID=1353952 RepID=A0A165CV44_9BASI|nr:hypothetical protein CALCODRAFT_521358 [Calocera cornea HHB12733]